MGTTTSAILGDTNHFFVPWLIPRNDRNSVFAPNFFGKLAGRTGRSLSNNIEKSDLFTLRIQYCEEEVISCLDNLAINYESLQQTNERFSLCEPIYLKCLKDQQEP